MTGEQIKLLEQLSNAKSSTRGTSLITVYVPGGTNLNLVTTQLSNELSTAQNIKDKSVRTNVQTALKAGLQQLKNYSYTAPTNGLVLCCGETESCI